MKKNIVLYGNANQGKSTLFGYLFVKHNSIGLEKYVRFFRETVFPNDYDPEKLFAWIVNKDYVITKTDYQYDSLTGEKIRIDTLQPNKTGNNINCFNRGIPFVIDGKEVVLNFIDTPGQDEYQNKRDEGLFQGDIGIFCVEIAEVLKGALDENYFEQYDTFSRYISRSKQSSIIVLTKMDMCEQLTESDYDRACNLIRKAGKYDKDVPIIPISINTKNPLGKESENIFNSSKFISWHKTTLEDAIISAVKG